MSTTWYFRDTASDLSTADTDKAMDTTRGAGTVTKATNTQNGPISSPFIQLTDGAGGAAISWFTPRLNAITIAPLSSNSPSFQISGLENNMSANATIRWAAQEVDNSGVAVGSVLFADLTAHSELGTTNTVIVGTYIAANGDTANTINLTAGNRLRFRVYLDDGSGVTMATGFTASFSYDGANGSLADSFVNFSEDMTLYTPPADFLPYRSPLVQLLPQ